MPDAAALLIVGDIDQLPSVGPGQMLGRHHRLRRRAGGAPHRSVPASRPESASSPALIASTRGRFPISIHPKSESDFYFVKVEDPETAVVRIIELVKTRIPKRFGLDPIRDIQVLCPMNRGGAGATIIEHRAAGRT